MKKLALLIALALPIVALAATEPKTTADVEAGVHYFELFPDQEAGSTDKIEVVEFFWYGCPHCYHLEPYLNPWLEKKPDNVAFSRVPAVFNALAAFHAESYYALEMMGAMNHDLHEAIFREIQENHNRLGTPDEMEAFLKKQGVDVANFKKTLRSFAVKTKVRRAASLAKRYGVNGVPSMVVDGEYRTGSGSAGYQGTLVVVDRLIEDIEKEKKAQ